MDARLKVGVSIRVGIMEGTGIVVRGKGENDVIDIGG